MSYVLIIWEVAREAAPWLLLGLVAAGLIRALVPTAWMSRQLGGRGIGSVLKASALGIPLPLCSCGVLPAAIGLRRQGASRPATAAFLVSTPEIGVDSIALSYALLGPFMAVVRPVAAFVSAVAAGVAAMVFGEKEGDMGHGTGDRGCCASAEQSCCHENSKPSEVAGIGERLGEGMRYVFTQLWDDIKWWLLAAVVIAGVMLAIFPEPAEALQRWGSGPLAMVLMLLVGIPLYVCATASTPIAAGLLVAGVSPGTVLVLLLAGPATNIGSIAILRRELGTRTLIAYLAAIAVMSIACGLAVDWIVNAWSINIVTQVQHAHHFIPDWLATAAAVILIAASIKPLRRIVLGQAPESATRHPGHRNAGEQSASCCEQPTQSSEYHARHDAHTGPVH